MTDGELEQVQKDFCTAAVQSLMSPYSKIVVSLTTAGTLGFFLTAKALSIGDTYPQPKTENTTPLRGCFSTHDNIEGVIIGEDEIQYGKVWRDGEQKIFEWYGPNLKNMNVVQARVIIRSV